MLVFAGYAWGGVTGLDVLSAYDSLSIRCISSVSGFGPIVITTVPDSISSSLATIGTTPFLCRSSHAAKVAAPSPIGEPGSPTVTISIPHPACNLRDGSRALIHPACSSEAFSIRCKFLVSPRSEYPECKPRPRERFHCFYKFLRITDTAKGEKRSKFVVLFAKPLCLQV